MINCLICMRSSPAPSSNARPAPLRPSPQCLPAIALALFLIAVTGWAEVPPTASWLRYYGLEAWEVILDHDQDGFNAEIEFTYGTDPFDPLAHPPRFMPGPDGMSFRIEIPVGVSFGHASLQTSTDLAVWTPVPDFPPPAPATFVVEAQPGEPARFFHFSAPGLANSDDDCLLDFEELNLFHTDPLLTDSDGDGLDDCAEVLVYHTDPTQGSSTGRGAIHGRVVLDEDRDPATQNHPGLAGWTAFADLDLDGEWDPAEPSAISQSDGSYVISELDPGFYRVSLVLQPVWGQVFPALTPVPTPDGYPDRVVEVFDSGTGPIAFPYGRYASALPGLRVIVPSPPPDPVEASVVIGPLPPPPIAGAFGGWEHVDILAIPTNSFVTVAFDGEEIVDGPGPDLALWCAANAPNDQAEVYLGTTASDLTSVGFFPQTETIPLDLATLGVPGPVRYVKVRGVGMVGTYPGIDLVGFEALHYRALGRGHYDVSVQGGRTVSDINFGVAGDDRPPKILLSTGRTDVRAGDTITAQVTVTDDLGIGTVQLTANGATVALDEQLRASIAVGQGGLLTLVATATDTANQQGSTLLTLIARNEDGSLPDLSGLQTEGGSAAGGPSIHILTPVAGEILSTPRQVVGTIVGTTQGLASWQLHYAPAELVNPRALDAPDPDFFLLSEGTGPVFNGNLGNLPGDTLSPGGYLLRATANDTQGTTRYLGFVFGVRVDPLDLRPAITLSSPTNDSTVTFLTEIHGSVTTRQELREWYVERAPLSQVNLLNLSDPTPAWTRIASGTNPVTNGLLATFDPTLLPNDSHVLRVSAWNQNGLGWAEALVLHVTGGAKLGDFAVEFTDLELPLAGIPLTIKRQYNSLNAARSGDFGYGWSLAIQEADIAETVPQTGTGFGSTPFKIGTRVYLTAPNGERIGFSFQPEVGAVSFLGAAYRAVFRPDPGVPYTLMVPEGDSAFLSLNAAGEAALFFVPVAWNPDTYILTDPEGTRYTYDQADGLLEIVDASGNRLTFAKEAIRHSAGPQVQLVRDSAGRVTEMAAPDGRTWRYRYDANGDLIEVKYPGDIVATLGYASARPHFLETIQDPLRGPTLRTEYDENGRVTAVIDSAGNRREQTWEPNTFRGSFTDARGNVTRLTYDTRGNLIRREDPLGGITTWEYRDANHPNRQTAMVDPRGHRTTSRYDVRGNPVEHRTPIATTLITYNPSNRVTRIQYGGLGTEEFAYDDAGHLVEQKSQLTTSSFTHTASGLLASILDAEGGVTRIEYEGALQVPSRILLPDGTSKQFAYNASGRMVRSTDPLGGITQYEYDAAGRLVREIDPSGAETRTTYDALFPQSVSTVTDRAGRARQYACDALGRLTQETAPGGAITRYEHDADGNRTAVVDPLGNRYEFRYDAMNRLIQEIDPSGEQRLHRYDAAGNRIETVDRNGRRRTFSYDAHNRVVEERWHDSTDDHLVRTITFTYNRNDELVTLSDPDATIHLGRMYVPGGPLQSEEARYTGAPVRRVAYAYDSATRRSSVAVTTTSPVLEPALSVRYTRDQAGRLWILQSQDPLPPSTLKGLAFQLQFWRNLRGDITELRRFSDQNGDRQVSQSFLAYSDPCHCHLERIEHVVATNQPLPDATLALSRDPEGTLTQLDDGPDSFVFDHDPAGQLAKVRLAGVPIETYAYDLSGNRLASHRHDQYVIGSGNRLTQAGSWASAYDAEGNLLTKSNVLSGVHYSFTWDHRNRLTRVELEDPNATPSLDTTEYRYDALDRRIALVRAEGITWTYYDGVQPLVDFRDQETTPARIQYTGEKLDELHALWQRDQGLFWVLTDHLGSPRRLLDRNGVEVGRFDYDSFGNLRSVTGTQTGAVGRFAFTGREWDPNTGLYYYRARYYDPDLGRFIQEDPMGFGAGDANLYRYVFNQPLTLTDPTGLMTAKEYGSLLLALARPGNFCQFALCVNNLWNGVANSVINLVPGAKPDPGCAVNLVGVPDLSSLGKLGIDMGIGGARMLAERAGVSHPALDLGLDLLICAVKN